MSGQIVKPYEERRAELEAAAADGRARAEREIREFERAQRTVRERVDREQAGREASETALAAQLNDAIARDALTAFEPLVRAWQEEPSRQIALAMVEVYRVADQRARLELGAPAWPGLLFASFATIECEANPSAINALGWHLDMATVGALGGIERAATENGAASVVDAIHALERAVQGAAKRSTEPPIERLVRRLAVMGTCATRAFEVARLNAFDEQSQREDQAEATRNWTPPAQGSPILGRAVNFIAGLIT